MTKKMADESWHQLRKIFDDALRQKPEQRRSFVNEACGGDENLLAEVESLLSSHESAESFMETPAIARVADQILPENRQFSNGQFLNHYEILKQIGAGGMGEVYLAQDSKLNRKVAIKVLHQNLSSDNQANRRLLREAQAAALLDHPHICTIYEISETDDCSFIVMQYVEGETLGERLAKERLDTRNSLDLAIQIADALAEAHSRGIIHRDIKPANIIINEKGQAKVLDFGLAKFIEAESNRETTKRLNSSGAVMGTVPFMSPEQLRGRQLDARTDIFSFGAVFYEMLTGRQAFARESNAETISAILNDQPDLTHIPLKIQPIVRKALMKDCGERYQSAHDLARDLRDAQKSVEFLTETADEFDQRRQAEDVSTSKMKRIDSNEHSRSGSNKRRFYFWNSSNPGGGAVPPTEKIGSQKTAKSEPARFNHSVFLISALTIFLAISATVLVFWQFNKTDDSRQFDSLRPVRLVSWKAAPGGYYTDYSVSHDGKLIAYSSSQEGGKENIYIKQTADGEEIRVTKDEWTNVSPIWSPDDHRIAYSSIRETNSGIYVIPALGGAATPVKIIGRGDVLLRHWSKEGAAIFYEYQGNLFRLDLATQEAAQVTDFASAPGTERQFSFSPDEAQIAFCDKTDGQIDVWIMPAGGGERQRLTNDRHEEFRPRWHSDGRRILYAVERENDSQISLAYTDGRPPVQITRGDGDYNLIDVSADGTKIFYFSYEDRSDISGVKTETGEEFEVATTNKEYEQWAEVSPDGKSILFQSKTGKHLYKTSIVVKPIGGGSPTFGVEGYNPRWLPDSRRISFVLWFEEEQKYHLFVVNTANGEQKQLTTVGVTTPSHSSLPKNRGEISVEDFSTDGGKFVFINQKAPKNVWAGSIETGETVNLTNNLNPSLRYTSPLFSADGGRIVFVSRETVSGKMIYGLWLWEGGMTKKIFSTEGGLRLLGWSASGDEILLEMTDGVMKATPLDVKLLQVALTGESRILTTFKNIYADAMTLSDDGKTLAFTARQNGKDDIWTAAAIGGEPKKITANGSTRLFYASLAWSPDGKTIFFDKQEQINTISMFENFK